MKFTLKRSSMVYKLVNNFGTMNDRYDLNSNCRHVDFCRFCRMVIKASLFMLFIMCVFSFLITLFVTSLVGQVAGINYYFGADISYMVNFFGEEFTRVVYSISGVVTVFEIITLGVWIVKNYAYKVDDLTDGVFGRLREKFSRDIWDRSPGFLSIWYRSYKDKYCPLVEVE